MKLHSPPTFLLDSWGWTMEFSSEKARLDVRSWKVNSGWPELITKLPLSPLTISNSPMRRRSIHSWHFRKLSWKWLDVAPTEPPPLPVPLYPPRSTAFRDTTFPLGSTSSLPQRNQQLTITHGTSSCEFFKGLLDTFREPTKWNQWNQSGSGGAYSYSRMSSESGLPCTTIYISLTEITPKITGQLEDRWHRLTSGSSMAFDKLGASSRRKRTNLTKNLGLPTIPIKTTLTRNKALLKRILAAIVP